MSRNSLIKEMLAMMQSYCNLSILQFLKSSPIGKGKGMSCKFEGKVYKDGERMPCGDGCNIRYCINGKPSGCTKVGCVRFEGKRGIVKTPT